MITQLECNNFRLSARNPEPYLYYARINANFPERWEEGGGRHSVDFNLVFNSTV